MIGYTLNGNHNAITLPSSVESERAILGAVLLNNAAFEQADLQTQEFLFESHRRIWQRMRELVGRAAPIDLVTLTEELARKGDLDLVGGASYVSSLTDGLPRLSSISYYTKLVRDKALLRASIRAAEAIVHRAQQGPEDVGEFLTWARQAMPTGNGNGHGPAPLIAVNIAELLGRDIKPRAMLLDPILPDQGLAMLYAKRGDGKTYIAIGIGVAVASAGKFLRWQAPSSKRVLYIDGELPAKTLQERLAMIVAGADREPGRDMLQFVTPDLQQRSMPDLATIEGQAAIEPLLTDVSLVIIDNLSALCRNGKENEGEGWLPVQDWALSLRRRGLSVLFVHHAGKNGDQRGSSRREDLLDTVVSLRRPSDYCPNQGLRVEIHFEKTRGMLSDAAKPFEVSLTTGDAGAAVFSTRDVEDAKYSAAAQLFSENLSVRDVADELKISRSQAGRLRKRWDASRDGGTTVPRPTPLARGTRDTEMDGGADA